MASSFGVNIMEYRYGNVYMKKILYFNIYVIKGKDGDILIDTGFIGMRKALKKWLDQFNIKLIILTHAHVDHVWNAAYFSKLYNAKIAMSKDDIINLDNSRIHAKPLKRRYGLWTRFMNLGMRVFVPDDFKVNIKLKNNSAINRYGIKLKIVSLSGHTDGSIGIVYDHYLFAGDALVFRGKYPTLPYQCQNVELAKKQVKVIEDIGVDKIFIGHDKVIDIDRLVEEKAY